MIYYFCYYSLKFASRLNLSKAQQRERKVLVELRSLKSGKSEWGKKHVKSFELKFQSNVNQLVTLARLTGKHANHRLASASGNANVSFFLHRDK